jgi:hypothetical protein
MFLMSAMVTYLLPQTFKKLTSKLLLFLFSKPHSSFSATCWPVVNAGTNNYVLNCLTIEKVRNEVLITIVKYYKVVRNIKKLFREPIRLLLLCTFKFRMNSAFYFDIQFCIWEVTFKTKKSQGFSVEVRN